MLLMVQDTGALTYGVVVNEMVAIPQYSSGGRGFLHRGTNSVLVVECVLSTMQNYLK